MRSRLASDRVVLFEFILSNMFKLAPFQKYIDTHTHRHSPYSLLSALYITRVR